MSHRYNKNLSNKAMTFTIESKAVVVLPCGWRNEGVEKRRKMLANLHIQHCECCAGKVATKEISFASLFKMGDFSFREVNKRVSKNTVGGYASDYVKTNPQLLDYFKGQSK